LLVEQLRHLVIGHWLRKLHRDLLELPEQIPCRLHRFFDVPPHVLRRVEYRYLRQESDAGPGVRPCFALKILIDARHDLEQ
jgi:hypothetical protein